MAKQTEEKKKSSGNKAGKQSGGGDRTQGNDSSQSRPGQGGQQASAKDHKDIDGNRASRSK